MPHVSIPLAWRIGLATFGAATLATVVMAVAFQGVLVDLCNRALAREMADHHLALTARLDAEALRARSMASLVAAQPAVAEALAAGDRPALEQRFLPGFAHLKTDLGVRQFQFHQPPATSFFRVHKPEKHGDDLSGFHQTVVQANRTGDPVWGLERGVAGLGIRGVVPVTDTAGASIGSVEFGMALDEAFISHFEEAYDVDLSLHLVDDRAGSAEDAVPPELRSALAGDEDLRWVPGPDAAPTWAAMARPVRDYQGAVVGVVDIQMDAGDYLSRQAAARDRAFLWGGAVIALAALLGAILGRGIAAPIRRMTTCMDRLADRDYSVDLPQVRGTDEVGRMAASLAFFADKSREIAAFEAEQKATLAKVEGEREKLTDEAHENLRGLVDVAIESNETMVILAHMMTEFSETSRLSQTMAAAVEELVTSVKDIARNSDSVAQDAEAADRSAQDGVSAAHQAVATMENIYQAVDTAETNVEKLAASSARIGEIVQEIEDIASQTNLLALNATIEAARAGDAGKGFAVVAGEVKTLSNQTGKATDDIRGRIASLRAEMEAIVGSMHAGAEAVKDGRSRIAAMGDQLTAISRGIGAISASMRDMAQILGQQTEAANEVASGTSHMAALAARNDQEVKDILSRLDQVTEVLGTRTRSLAGLGTPEAILEVAKNDHMAFRKQVVAAVTGRVSLRESDLPSHTTCRLGQWYCAVTDPALTGHPGFRALEAPHKAVHDLGRRAVHLAGQGDTAGALEVLDALGEASRKVVEALDALARDVSTRNGHRAPSQAAE